MIELNKKEEENDELERVFSLDEEVLDVNDDALFEDITEKPEFDFKRDTKPVFVFTPRTEPEVETSDIEVESCPNFVALLDDKEDTTIKSGGGDKNNKIV